MDIILILLNITLIFLFIISKYFSGKFRKKVLEIISKSPGYSKLNKKKGNFREELLSFLDYTNHVMEEQYALEVMNQKAKLHALQSQINPHFLYNTLDTIRGKAYEDNVQDIAEMAEMLALMFRYTIGQNDSLVTVEEEIDSVQNYICIQQYRFNIKYDLKIEIEDEKLREYQIPKLTLQPIAENAVKYGFSGRKKDNVLTIRVFRTQTYVMLNIMDNGRGMTTRRLAEINERLNAKGCLWDERQEGRGTGIALDNVNARIKLLFGEMYGLSVYSSEGMGTTIEIMLPGEQHEIREIENA